MDVRFWEDDPDAPYATLLSVIETYCHPSAWEGAYDQLRALAAHSGDERMAVFKRELSATVRDPSVVPVQALREAAEYGDGGPAEFAARLWRDLYPDDPFPK